MVFRNNISEAKAQLSALIAMVPQGHEVILSKAGKPVAKIVPYGGAAKKGRARLRERGGYPTARFFLPKPVN